MVCFDLTQLDLPRKIRPTEL